MKSFTFAIFILTFALAVGNAMAAPTPKTQDIPITQQISDYDANSVAYSIQSDGLGSYLHTVTTVHNKSTGDYSVLMANVCNDKNLPNGDRLLETYGGSAPVRTVKITLDSTNAIQSGDPNYVGPAQFFGVITSTVRNMNTCTCATNQSMYAMGAGTTVFCPMHFLLKAVNYRLEMAGPGDYETQQVQIFCNAADSAGCKEWMIDPISNPDYTTNPGRTRARLVDLSNGQNIGDYYVTFHLHLTRP
jgi:hypothetical protein